MHAVDKTMVKNISEKYAQNWENFFWDLSVYNSFGTVSDPRTEYDEHDARTRYARSIWDAMHDSQNKKDMLRAAYLLIAKHGSEEAAEINKSLLCDLCVFVSGFEKEMVFPAPKDKDEFHRLLGDYCALLNQLNQMWSVQKNCGCTANDEATTIKVTTRALNRFITLFLLFGTYFGSENYYPEEYFPYHQGERYPH